jgi:hypothetical protein
MHMMPLAVVMIGYPPCLGVFARVISSAGFRNGDMVLACGLMYRHHRICQPPLEAFGTVEEWQAHEPRVMSPQSA